MIDLEKLATSLYVDLLHGTEELAPKEESQEYHAILDALQSVRDEAAAKDYEAMREFQAKFIASDQEVRRLRENLRAQLPSEEQAYKYLQEMIDPFSFKKHGGVCEQVFKDGFRLALNWIRDNLKPAENHDK